MKIFRREKQSETLLIFADGWGMDERPVLEFLPREPDLWILSDYDGETCVVPFEKYARTELAAWSLGVWMAARLFAPVSSRFASRTAINGTLEPIHAQYGIDPAVFDGTLANWSLPMARDKFMRRMTSSGEVTPPARDWENQRRELEFLRDAISMSGVAENIYDRALIGRRDRIFPAGNQRAAWARLGVPCEEGDYGHFPFGFFSS